MKETSGSSDTQALGRVMAILAWILALLLLGLFFNYWLDKKHAVLKPTVVTEQGLSKTIIKRTEENQYLANGSINGKEVVFLLDTGATDIVIPANIAKELNLAQGYETYATTAGGNVKVYQTHIAELTIGHLTLHNLNASISYTLTGNQVLLGMSALKRLEFIQRGDTLILQQFIP